MLGRLNTKDRLMRFGLTADNACHLCGSEVEDHKHLFFGFQFSVRYSQQIAAWLRMTNSLRNLPDLVRWVHRRKLTSFRKSVIYTIVWCTVYHIWGERNNALWNVQIRSIDSVCSLVKHRVHTRLRSILPKALCSRDHNWYKALFEG